MFELFKSSDGHLNLCFLFVCLLFKFYGQSFVSPISKFALRYSNVKQLPLQMPFSHRVNSESCQIKKKKKPFEWSILVNFQLCLIVTVYFDGEFYPFPWILGCSFSKTQKAFVKTLNTCVY